MSISKGYTLEATGHRRTEVRNKKDATSENEGYTGDTYCKDCGELVKKGETIPKLPSVGNISGISAIEQSILNDMNAARAAEGLGALSWDSKLYGGTKIRANEYRYWSNEGGHEGDPHHRPDGTCYYTVFDDIGVGIGAYPSHGEILAANTDSNGLFNSWMNSSGHKRLILMSNYTHVSITVINSNGVYYACAIFHD